MNTEAGAQQAYDLRILRALRRITRAVALHSRQLSACNHITGPQLVCLRTVLDKGPLTATAISREVHVSASTVVGILDRLEDKGLIVRERGRADRRIVFVSATDAGRQLAHDTPSPLQQKLAESLNALPELEQATITLSLERVVDLIEAGTDLIPASEAQSPMLDVPVTGVAPESGLVV
ncbi:MarR family winged helix-turn-helix transcriptional regulator [Castellaniella sp.]|uniref:MarR family winged helix-turn-helix transcriptional regulator n=1 Tax=Castellaniella sp. TaxID=1955812 RepID=UPI003C781AE1